MLAEEAALELVRTHGIHLRGLLSLSPADHLHKMQQWLRLRVTSGFIDVHLRLAIGMLNAIASCQGYNPRLESKFWRVVLLFVMDGVDNEPGGSFSNEHAWKWPPLDPDIFSRYELSCEESGRLATHWDDVGNDEVNCQREEALQSVRCHATRAIPMIQFRLVLSRVTQASINSATRLSMRLRDPFQVMIQETPHVTTLFSPLTALAISPMVTLHTVTIGLPSTTKRKAYTLIHALILDSRSRVVSLGFHCNPSFTLKDIAAVCSALPYAHTLRSVEFSPCVRFGEDARQDVLSWIHYAWTHPRVVSQIGSLRRCFVQGSLQSFESPRLDLWLGTR